MKYFKNAIFAMAAVMAGVGAIAMAEVRLIDPEYDFGIIKELDGTKTGYAHLVNIGKDTTYIQDVRPSCGCTGADYDSSPLAPGDTAVVSFSYNPTGRPGSINKTVKVYVGDEGERHVIRLTGRVVGSPLTLSANYPIECGSMRLSERVVELKGVKAGAGRHAFVRMVNQSMDTIVPNFENSSKALSIDIAPRILAPGEIGSLGIYFNSRFAEDSIGSPEYEIPVFVTGERDTVPVAVRVTYLD